MKPRHGAISSTLLTLAGVLGLSAAGLSVVTGVTPCSLMSSCDTDAAPTAMTVAGTCETKTEKAEEVTLVSDTASDCSTAKDCSGEAKTVAVSDSDCSSKTDCDGAKAVTVAAANCATKSDCDKGEAVTLVNASDCSGKSECDGAKAVTVAAASDCSSKTDCDEAKAVTVAAAADCASECSGEAKAVAVNAADCASKSDCDKGDAVTLVNAADSDCSTKSDCGMKAVAASDSSECGGECADGDVKALPVAVHAFNTDCPYSGNAAKADIVSAYNGMNVSFCCNGCKGRFDKADDATRAKKVAGVTAPINDTCCNKPVEASTMAVVQGFPVAFCKSACGEMVAKAPAEKQRAFVASHIKPVNKECCGTSAAEAKMVGFHNGKAVALCGDKCAEHFNAASAEKKDAWMAKMVSDSSDKNCEESACEGDKDCGEKA